MNKDFNKFDKMARDAFEGFEVDYNPEDWELMESKLDKKEHLMPYIWLFKGVEAIVLLLFLFTAVNFWFQQSGDQTALADQDGTSQADHLQRVNNEESESHNMAKENTQNQSTNGNDEVLTTFGTAQKVNTNETNPQGPVASSNHTTVEQGSSDRVTSTTTTFNETIAKENKQTKGAAKFKQPLPTASAKSGSENAKLENGPLATANTATKEKYTVETLPQNQLNEEALTTVSETPVSTNSNNSTTQLEQLTTADVATNKMAKQHQFTHTAKGYLLSDNTVDPVDASKNPIRPKGGKDEGNFLSLSADFKFPDLYHRQTRLGVYAAADMNFRSQAGDNSLGMSLGVMMEHEISKPFSLSYGVIGTRKNFEDYFVRYIDRTASEGVVYRAEIFKRTSLATLQVPAYFNFHAIRTAKWKLGVSVGGAAEVLTGRYAIGSQRTAVDQQAGGLVVVSELNSRSEERGFFQGGKISDNSVLMLGGGLNIERQLSDRISLSLQPRYHHAMGNFGTDANRIHNFSVNVGIQTVIR